MLAFSMRTSQGIGNCQLVTIFFVFPSGEETNNTDGNESQLKSQAPHVQLPMEKTRQGLFHTLLKVGLAIEWFVHEAIRHWHP